VLVAVADTDGWRVVTKKGEFQVGSRCVYFEIDSILPDREEFAFLKKGDKPIRLKTIKLRGQISQGLVMPISIIPPEYINLRLNMEEGMDVTDILGVTKYEPEVHGSLGGTPKGNFPAMIHKTDEERVQNLPKLLEQYKGTRMYLSEKVDGSSITCYLQDGKFGVCSRNIDLEETEGNAFWQAARMYDVEEKIKEISAHFDGADIALQGELLGPGIQGNKYALDKYQIMWFNIFLINEGEYLSFYEFHDCIVVPGLKTVPILDDNFILDHTVDELLAMAEGYSVVNPKIRREGLVIRPIYEIIDFRFGRLSFKVINNKFLLKYE
jgi:RNA ligase (TIGR02306 family)